jgi:crotonobetainyl-CoA:carnitine CoA-transferase CaiB-like acyl-CoA transferase
MAGSDIMNAPGMTKEMRNGVIAAFDALSNWRDEIESVNERCLSKVLDQIAAVARSMGWPEQAIRTTREYLERTSKVQTEMIDQITDGWKQQLKSTTAPMAMPRSFTGQVPGAMLEFNPLAPWNFWLQAAEMWQRTWMPEMPSRRDTRSH